MVTNIIGLGDKVDIRLVQQVERKEKSNAAVHVYKSQVSDITDSGDLELAMPIEGGKILLLPLGVRFEFIFYTKGGMYHCIGEVKERYKRNNIYLCLIEIHSQLKKFQRREYYRYPCLLETQFLPIQESEIHTPATLVYAKFDEKYILENRKTGTILDLSGGGIKLLTGEPIAKDSYILLEIKLNNEKMDKEYYIYGHVLNSSAVKDNDKKYENRVKFLFDDNKIQEEIIRYIFEEERKVRKKS